MRIIFFGTDEFAKDVLAFLLQEKLDLIAVVTRADKPKGRSQKVEAPPVKEICFEMGFKGEVYQPLKASADEFVETLKKLKPDLFVVVSYGQILKQNVLDIPLYGTINVHPSLLPKYRGPSPIQSAVLAGDKETGVTIMEMELAMDAGGIIKVTPVEISEETTYEELEKCLAEIAKKSLLEVLQEISISKKIVSTPQNEKDATYTKKIHAEDAFIDWNQSSDEICNFVRGMNSRPGARTFVDLDGKKVLIKIFRMRKISFEKKEPGQMIYFNKERGLVISTKDGAVELLELQLEGKKKMSTKDFINGFSTKIKFCY
ncbi:MAG: methionyl-tRNA formyltransferase [Chlamydiae bacterium]|jgi:methionyl-tRNA formyltransferase|nr:methionyl-tRNA formyltransferase [Chlamydiota bacterium]